MKKIILFITFLFVTACAGKMEYIKPITNAKLTNSKEVNKSLDDLWKTTVPSLGKNFFVINNIDKSSGLINVSYSGDPEKYVDCGRIKSYVKNARGERTYDFPASKAYQNYESFEDGMNLIFVDRKMNLEGRVNLIFESISKNSTRITANTKYVITKSINYRDMQNRTSQHSEVISFNSGASAYFANLDKDTQGTECVPTGILEEEILSTIK